MVRVVSSVLFTAKEIPQCWRKAGTCAGIKKRLWQAVGKANHLLGPLPEFDTPVTAVPADLWVLASWRIYLMN